MKIEHLYLVSVLAVLSGSLSADGSVHGSDSKPKVLRGPRPIQDRFRNIQKELTTTHLNGKIDVFKSYGCEHMVVLSNEATSPILLWCSSGDEDVKEIQVIPEQSFAFTFRPKKNGKSVFQCVLNYEEKWTTFAVYNEEELYSPLRENSYVYSYSVRVDGVYVNHKHKIKSFFRVFDYSTDDDYVEDYNDMPDKVVHVPKAIPDGHNSTKANLPTKRNLLDAPKSILDRFNSVMENVSPKGNLMKAPTLIVDRFNIIRANLSKEDIRTEIDDFVNYDCERMVVLSNRANASFRLWCNCNDDSIRDTSVSVGRSISFSFKPKHNGNSRFQCILNYRSKWATFDVFNGTGTERCTCKKQNTYLHQFSIRHYGIFDEGNTKIKSLFNGRNQYTLWETHSYPSPYGKLMSGYVDGPEDCRDVPYEVNDKSSAVTVCDYQCVTAYEHIKCKGRSQKIKAYSGCRDVKLEDGLDNELSSVGGC